MSLRDVTVVVVPRERFSFTRRSLERLYETTPAPGAVVCVDGGSPPSVKAYLAAQARERGFRLIRSEHYLTQNEARSLALPHVDTPYVAFVDNDVLVTPGWLETLKRCADETGAWVVGPIYCIGEPELSVVHMAGGVARFDDSGGGGRDLVEVHRFSGARLDRIRAWLRRAALEMVEFHCLLARMDVFARLGPLDEALLSSPEHIDLCLSVRAAGQSVYFEPAAAVTYVPPPPYVLSDLPYYCLRWSEGWNRKSLAHFAEK